MKRENRMSKAESEELLEEIKRCKYKVLDKTI